MLNTAVWLLALSVFQKSPPTFLLLCHWTVRGQQHLQEEGGLLRYGYTDTRHLTNRTTSTSYHMKIDWLRHIFTNGSYVKPQKNLVRFPTADKTYAQKTQGLCAGK